MQDEATTISRTTKAATNYHARTTATIHPATNGKTNHATDHQSAERSVVMIFEKSKNYITSLVEYEEFKQEENLYRKFILNPRIITHINKFTLICILIKLYFII